MQAKVFVSFCSHKDTQGKRRPDPMETHDLMSEMVHLIAPLSRLAPAPDAKANLQGA